MRQGLAGMRSGIELDQLPKWEDLSRRFWTKVDKSSDCWLWTGKRNANGYGIVSIGGKGRYYMVAHRVAYLLTYGHLPSQMLLCHHCDMPACVNPAHLFVGTVQDNNADMHEKGRQHGHAQRGELNEHAKLTEQDVITIRRRYRSGETQMSIARDYGITQVCVSMAVLGKNWGHVKEEI